MKPNLDSVFGWGVSVGLHGALILGMALWALDELTEFSLEEPTPWADHGFRIDFRDGTPAEIGDRSDGARILQPSEPEALSSFDGARAPCDCGEDPPHPKEGCSLVRWLGRRETAADREARKRWIEDYQSSKARFTRRLRALPSFEGWCGTGRFED
jgi:hypothetical protein